MKQLYIVANWKSNKTSVEAAAWFDEIVNCQLFPILSGSRLETTSGAIVNLDEKKVIICPSFTHLSAASQILQQTKLPFALGSQDISPFPEGAHTGQINAVQLKEYAQYVIIGHSERRNEVGETPHMIEEKVAQAIRAGLIPILCVQDQSTPIPHGIDVVAYEPVFAIGTGQADTPENAQKVAKEIKDKHPNVKILYGGSVTPENVSEFTLQEDIQGVLVGSASLSATSFAHIIQNA